MNILKEECVLNPIITWNGYKAKRDSSITDSYSSPSKGNEFITTFKQDIQGHKKGLSEEENRGRWRSHDVRDSGSAGGFCPAVGNVLS